ncbi:MAG: FxLYD domain-containing protein [Actinomycetota bacterium]
MVHRTSDGSFEARANVQNRSGRYLNDITFAWRIVDAAGARLDSGEAQWPNLAPGETTTIELKGHSRYNASWERVVFQYET